MPVLQLGGIRFGDRFTFAWLLGSPGAIFIASLVALLLMVFVGGFVVKALGMAPEFVSNSTWWDVFDFFQAGHWVAGSVLVLLLPVLCC